MRMMCGEKRRALRTITIAAPILALAVGATAQSIAHASTNSTAATLTTAADPTSIATGDSIGEGHPDLAVVDYQDARVAVSLNTGSRSSRRSGGSVTTTPSLASSSNRYYAEEDLKVANTALLTALHVAVVVRKTGGVSYAGQYTTFPSGAVTRSYRDVGNTIVYNYDLAPGRTIPAGTYTIGSQIAGNGRYHASTNDTYLVTADAGSGTRMSSGHFSALGSPPPTPNISATGSVAAWSGPYYTEEDVKFSTIAPLTALHLIVTVRKTAGFLYAGQYTTFPFGAVTRSHRDVGNTIVYSYNLAPGHIIRAGTYTVGNQFSGDGQAHPINQDSYSGSATSGGTASALFGRFQP